MFELGWNRASDKRVECEGNAQARSSEFHNKETRRRITTDADDRTRDHRKESVREPSARGCQFTFFMPTEKMLNEPSATISGDGLVSTSIAP